MGEDYSNMDRNLALEVVRVTEAAALAASRWMGEYLLDHDHAARCVCHRVVRRDGDIGLYLSSDASEKRRRLESDGVRVELGRVDLGEGQSRIYSVQSRSKI